MVSHNQRLITSTHEILKPEHDHSYRIHRYNSGPYISRTALAFFVVVVVYR